MPSPHTYPDFINNPHDEKVYRELKRLSPEFRCVLGWHKWGPWNADRHPRSLTRAEAHCPLIHWPFQYRVCDRCGRAEWGHEPK